MTEAISEPNANIASLPTHEMARLEALRRYNILDTPPEKAFDRITSLAARLFDVPTTLISLVDESRAWFKSCFGFDRLEISRNASICNFALLDDDVLVILDTQQDERFVCNPFVQSDPGLRFYAGAPLLTEDGFNLGTLCLLDTQPHSIFTLEQKATLVDLAAMVMDELELRLSNRIITQFNAALWEVTQGVSGVTGKRFFSALVQHLSTALGVNYACISLLINQTPERVKTIAFYAKGEIVDNVEYELQGTPCLEVIRQQKIGCYVSNIQALFPNDRFLVSLSMESYAAIPFFDSRGKLLGLLTIMDNQPLDNVPLVESLLTLFAMRIGAELERQQAEEMQQEATQRLQLYADVVRNTQMGIVVCQLEDPNQRWVSAKGQAQFEGKGTARRAVNFFGTALDITDRKQAEAVLTKQEQRYRYIFEAVSVAIWEEDFSEAQAAIQQLKAMGIENFDQYFTEHPEFVQQMASSVRIQDVNQAALQMFGATEKPQLLSSLAQIFVPETQAAFMGELLAIAHEDTFFAAETVVQTLQGDRLNVWFSITFPPASEPYNHVLVSLLDITQRKQTEQDLQQHSERLNLLYETMKDLLFAERPLDLMNRLFNRLRPLLNLHYYYQFKLVEKNGKSQLKLMNYSGISEEQAKLFETIEIGQAMCGLVAQQRRQIILNKAEIDTHPNAQAICLMGVSAYSGQPLMVQGRLLGTLSFASLTRTEFTAEEVNLLQAISEQVAIALDRAELVTSLQQQTEDLAQANRIKDEFLAVLSHELRSPLNPILGWTKLLQTGKFDPQKTKQALEVIERNAKQQTQLIDDLLDISKILRGKLMLREAPVDLALTIEAALETMRLAAEAKSIQIKTEFDSCLPPVLGDGGRLQQIVLNLLSNAIKFTPTGGQVEITLKRIQSEAQIKVKDNGKGITPDFLPFVFESFRQEDGKITRKFGGLGLGLAIVRQLTELHGGTVQAFSQGEGTGATFTVGLPLMKTTSLRVNNSLSNDGGLSAVNVLEGIKVLVVDDEADMRDLVVMILEQAGAIAKTATSAAEALTIFPQFQPMLLISDIGMPDTDGYMLMRQIRALPSEQGGFVPAIALTAYAGEYDQQQALKVGFQKHLPKPIEPEALVKAISELINLTLPSTFR